MSGNYWQALDEYTEALADMCRERRMHSLSEPMATVHTSDGPIYRPTRIMDAEMRWAAARTRLRDARRWFEHDPGDEDRSER